MSKDAEAVVFILGEVYLCNLISLVSLQKTLEDSGIATRFLFFEDRVPSVHEMCRTVIESPGAVVSVICPGNVGFEVQSALSGLMSSSGKGRVPVALNVHDEDMAKVEPLFFSLSREDCQRVLDGERVLEGLPVLDHKFKALVEFTFRGHVGQRNFLKIR